MPFRSSATRSTGARWKRCPRSARTPRRASARRCRETRALDSRRARQHVRREWYARKKIHEGTEMAKTKKPMNYETLEVAELNAVAIVWMNRPQVRNAFN